MPLYAFEAMNSSGQEVKDEIEAGSSEEAIKKIRSKGFFPTKVREKAQKKAARKKKEEEVVSGPKRKMPLSIGGASDVLAHELAVSVNAIIWTLRATVFLLPPIAGLLTWRICHDLSRRGETISD